MRDLLPAIALALVVGALAGAGLVLGARALDRRKTRRHFRATVDAYGIAPPSPHSLRLQETEAPGWLDPVRALTSAVESLLKRQASLEERQDLVDDGPGGIDPAVGLVAQLAMHYRPGDELEVPSRLQGPLTACRLYVETMAYPQRYVVSVDQPGLPLDDGEAFRQLLDSLPAAERDAIVSTGVLHDETCRHDPVTPAQELDARVRLRAPDSNTGELTMDADGLVFVPDSSTDPADLVELQRTPDERPIKEGDHVHTSADWDRENSAGKTLHGVVERVIPLDELPPQRHGGPARNVRVRITGGGGPFFLAGDRARFAGADLVVTGRSAPDLVGAPDESAVIHRDGELPYTDADVPHRHPADGLHAYTWDVRDREQELIVTADPSAGPGIITIGIAQDTWSARVGAERLTCREANAVALQARELRSTSHA